MMSARLLFSGEGFQRGVQVLIELEVAVAKVVFCIWFHIKKVGIFQPSSNEGAVAKFLSGSRNPSSVEQSLHPASSCFCRNLTAGKPDENQHEVILCCQKASSKKEKGRFFIVGDILRNHCSAFYWQTGEGGV